MSGGPVVLDLQCTQGAHNRARGIPRYAHELALALVETRPDLVGRVLLNPALAPPAGIEPLLAAGVVAYADAPDAFPAGARIFHCLSPFELTPLEQVWPREASRRGLRLAATAYDLIPELLASRYLKDAGLRRRYRARLALLRAADRVLAISAAAGAEVSQRLELPPGRVAVVGTGTSSRYRPPESRERAGAKARAAVPGLEERFVLYTGGVDHRKNVESLLRAYAQLQPALRGRWQLVVACDMPDAARADYTGLCRRLRVASRVLLTGYVTDEALLGLYQSAGLVAFPSLAEGYGLPVAEALACGAPTIAADIPALAEQLPPDQRFDPTSVASIAGALERALADEGWLAELGRRAGAGAGGAGGRSSWPEVAARVAAVYEEMAAEPLHPWRRQPAVAFVSPLPPAASGVAAHSLRLSEELARLRRFDIDVFADGPEGGRVLPALPEGCGFRARSLPAVEALRGGYERRVYALGNSGNHVTALELLRRRPGVVIAHDVRLTNLYTEGAWNPAAVPAGLAGAVREMYGGGLPGWVGRDGVVDPEDEERYGLLMAREVVGLAERYLVTSQAAAALARLDAGSIEAAARIGVVPFAWELPAPGRSGFDGDWGRLPPVGNGSDWAAAGPPADGRPLVLALGVVHPVRQPSLLVEAFSAARRSLPGARLAFVGPASEGYRRPILERARALGVGGAVAVTGRVEAEVYGAWLARATLAVQLRSIWNGEASATVAECLLAGVPLVATGIGWVRELPEDCLVRVRPDVTPAALGALIAEVAGDRRRRGALARAARAYAPALGYRRAAEALADELFGPAGVGGAAVRAGPAVPARR